MRAVSKKIRMIHLQDKHCNNCKYQTGIEQYCIEQCEVGKELINLGKKEFRKRLTKVKTIEEKWDEKCKQAIILYNQGVDYPDIAKEVGCHVSNLYRELKKRGWLQM
ncbi:helix-turn-helix domain-containing protein [Bacillus cereus]|uniref:helix-turn-helix domain-containing protein n=1 Tax=Bacillus cereus TaxID=1396 RepID=UPI000BEDE8F0|nr:cobalamin biosynthesis protein [Bacillus cereus]PET44955.1 cobalamin biosynthesis protein [Bacillus cereus]PEV82762.1 cobalamin biosynthesis protein [Bacillus cereus]PFA44677.1 cobalamin biosynthesis protein [Bacillus cereus]PFD68848.1 cobalamin biosynthesis protein [Bacillus cereus]